MPSGTGNQPLVTYTGTPAQMVAQLTALLPNQDVRESPNPRNPGSMLDEMSPFAATQLRQELPRLAAALVQGQDAVAYGRYTVVAADDTANQINIVTGLGDLSLAHIGVCISRSGTLIANGTITEPTPGTIRIADKAASAAGATDAYTVTAGDIVTWIAFDPLG